MKKKPSRFLFSPPEACPQCGRKFDHVRIWGRTPPGKGSFVPCPDCRKVLAFGRGMRLHMATLQELDAISDETRRDLLQRIAKLERESLANIQSR